MTKLLILAYANKETINSINYINSLKKYKYNYKIVGHKEKWINFITKITACYNYLINLEEQYDLIAITDCYDVLACGYEEELILKFNTFKTDIVFSTENNCSQGKCIYLKNYYDINDQSINNHYKYLNAGFYIGKRNSIIKLLKFILNYSKKYNIVDDQLLSCIYCQKYPNQIKLDHTCKLMGTICYNIFDYKWKDDRLYNVKTDQTSCFLHSPCMTSDLSRRIDYYGKKILKDKYIKETIGTKLNDFYKYVKSSSILKLYFILFILILILIFIFNKRIFLILICIGILFFCKFI
jgi:hypothetical protein